MLYAVCVWVKKGPRRTRWQIWRSCEWNPQNRGHVSGMCVAIEIPIHEYAEKDINRATPVVTRATNMQFHPEARSDLVAFYEKHLDTCMYVYSLCCACIYVYCFLLLLLFLSWLNTSQYLAKECNTIRVDKFQWDKVITVIAYLDTCTCVRKQITMKMLKDFWPFIKFDNPYLIIPWVTDNNSEHLC